MRVVPMHPVCGVQGWNAYQRDVECDEDAVFGVHGVEDLPPSRVSAGQGKAGVQAQRVADLMHLVFEHMHHRVEPLEEVSVELLRTTLQISTKMVIQRSGANVGGQGMRMSTAMTKATLISDSRIAILSGSAFT
eukprot:227093-Rhodomonas_salina.4